MDQKKALALDSAAREEGAHWLVLVDDLLREDSWCSTRLTRQQLWRHKGFWAGWTLASLLGGVALSALTEAHGVGLGLPVSLAALSLWTAITMGTARDQVLDLEPGERARVFGTLPTTAARLGVASLVVAAGILPMAGVTFALLQGLVQVLAPLLILGGGLWWWLFVAGELVVGGRGVGDALGAGLYHSLVVAARTPRSLLTRGFRMGLRALTELPQGEEGLPDAAVGLLMSPLFGGAVTSLLALPFFLLIGPLSFGGAVIAWVYALCAALFLGGWVHVAMCAWTYQYMGALAERARLPARGD